MSLKKPLRLVLPLVLTIGALAGAPGVARAVDAVDGARTTGDAMFPNVGNGGYDALNYDVNLTWSATGVVGNYMTGVFDTASTTMKATTTGAPLKTFSLDFEGLTVDSVTVNGVPATYTRDQDAEAIKFKLIVTPATPVAGDFTTVVTYHGVPAVHVDPDDSWEGWAPTTDGAIFMGQPVGAMAAIPHNNTPGDKATWSFTTDVPSTLTNAAGAGASAVVGNGELASKTVHGDRTTWKWVQQKQMASELAIISIGKYDVLESDIVLASGRTLHEWSFVDSAISANTKTTINTRRASLKGTLDNLEKIYGPYPGNSVGVVVDTVQSGINYALETQDRPFFPSSISAGTLVHELTHQWYGDNVSPKLWTDIWINEGMATWGPTYNTNVLVPTTPDPAAVETTYYNSWNSTRYPADNAVWATPPGAQTDPAGLYDFHTYTRGAMFWEALHTAVRDTDFLKIIKAWQTENVGQSRSGADLKALAERISGVDLTAFYQDWILDADKPAWPAKYDVTLASTPASGAVLPGATLSYTLSTTNVGKVAMAGQVIKVDVADLVDDGTTFALPAGLTLDGTTLSWAVPDTALNGTASTTFDAVVGPEASSDTLAASVLPTVGSDCTACGTSYSVDAQPLAPAPVPTIAGAPVFGETLTAGTSGWDAGVTFGYQWLRSGAPIAGATASTYTPTVADLGTALSVQVTGAKPGYLSVTTTSAATGAVAPATFAGITATVSGLSQVGSKLSARVWDAGSGTTVKYRWTVGGKKVGSKQTLKLTKKMLRKKATVEITVSKPGYVTKTIRASSSKVLPK